MTYSDRKEEVAGELQRCRVNGRLAARRHFSCVPINAVILGHHMYRDSNPGTSRFCLRLSSFVFICLRLSSLSSFVSVCLRLSSFVFICLSFVAIRLKSLQRGKKKT